MQRLILILTLGLALLPRPAQASCSGFIDCLFGMTERTEIRNQRMIETARIEAQRDADVTRLQGEAEARIREAEAEVERVRQQQFATEAQRDVAIAEAQRRAEEYRTMIGGLVAEREAEIMANAQAQIAALQQTANIAIAGITQTGQTERWRIAGGWITMIVLIVMVGLAITIWLHGRSTITTALLLASPQAQRRLVERRMIEARNREIGLHNGVEYELAKRQ